MKTVFKWSQSLSTMLKSATLSFALFAMSQTKAANLLPTSLVVPPAPKFQTITWTNSAGASNRVRWGLARDAWTNGSAVIYTNRFNVTGGWHYAVSSLTSSGSNAAVFESTVALWPSNRVAGYWLKDVGTNPIGGRMITNEVLLCEYTNMPLDGKHYWQLEDRTKRWE